MSFHKRGVTLVELVIVLMILLSLAGIGISLYPDLGLRANLTGTLETLKELDNNFLLYETLTSGGMPDNLDLLTDALVIHRTEFLLDVTATDITAITAILNAPFGPLTPITTTEVIDAFSIRGSDSFTIPDPAIGLVNQTFDYFGGPAGETSIAATTDLFVVDDAVMLDKFNIDAAADDAVYIVLGLGNRASHVGSPTGLMEAPVYIPDVSKTAALAGIPPFDEVSVKDFYSRYLVVYKIEAFGADDVRVSFVACTYPSVQEGIANMSDILKKLTSLDEE